jgi:hypothetical protein
VPGGIYIYKYSWCKVFLYLPQKINNKWYWLTYGYKRKITTYTFLDFGIVSCEYKTHKQYLIDELRDKND